MKAIQSAKDAYRLSDLSIDKCSEIVPGSVYDFMHWLVNTKAFANATDTSENFADRNNLQVLAACHNVIPKVGT